MGYQFYVQDTRSLLHDELGLFTSDNQITRWINEARRDVAKITGCCQRFLAGQSAEGASAQAGGMLAGAIQPGALPDAFPAASNPFYSLNTAQNGMTTIAGVERYPYKGFFNPVLCAQYAGLRGIIDVVQIVVAWEGTFRPALTWMPWDDFQAYCRAYSNQTTSYPAVWSTFNDGEAGELWMFPVPSQACEIEAYVSCVPADIYSDDDVDALPEEMRNTVKYKAASLAFLTAQRYAQSEAMEQRFMGSIGYDVVARDRGKTPLYYPSVF
jgi:hypothetical protein